MPKVIGFNPVDLGYGGMKNYSGSDNNKILDDVEDGNYPTIVAGDPYWSDVSLLLKHNGSAIQDYSSNTYSLGTSSGIAAGGVTKFEAQSIEISTDNSANHFKIPGTSGMDFGTGDYCIEFWF